MDLFMHRKNTLLNLTLIYFFYQVLSIHTVYCQETNVSEVQSLLESISVKNKSLKIPDSVTELIEGIKIADNEVKPKIEFKLNNSIKNLKLASLVKDKTVKSLYSERVDTLLSEVEMISSGNKYKLLVNFMRLVSKSHQGDNNAISYVIDFLKDLTFQERSMIEFINQTKGIDFTEEDGMIFNASCIQETALDKLVKYTPLSLVRYILNLEKEIVIDDLVQETYKDENGHEEISPENISKVLRLDVNDIVHNKLRIKLKKRLMTEFNILDSYKDCFKSFLSKCDRCNNSCCQRLCVQFNVSYLSFFESL
jgi:hypothetical protein